MTNLLFKQSVWEQTPVEDLLHSYNILPCETEFQITISSQNTHHTGKCNNYFERTGVRSDNNSSCFQTLYGNTTETF